MTNGNNLPAGLPPIKRCRDYHLYDYKGNRYLDLYLDAGRALMGHKPGKVMLPVKNSLEKGVWSAYPSVYTGRLEKLLGKLFPVYEHRAFFANIERAGAALGDERFSGATEWLPLWKETAETLLIRPLLPGIDQTVIILSESPLPKGDIISPVLLEGIIRSFHDFSLFRERKDFSLWERFDSLVDWERKGSFLSYRGQGDYEGIVNKALENRIFLPGRKEQRACLPSFLSAHEEKTLLRLLASE